MWTVTEDPIVDLRSPIEFEHGAIPGAVNLPLLDNDERHEVGTTYKQVGRHDAVSLGLELFAAKAERFAQEAVELAGDQKRLVVHCARGGMRSKSVALWLATMGLNVELLEGGYKAYRKEVLAILQRCARHPMITLHGRTGSGKTSLLRALSQHIPVLDFEHIAAHRGSAFGDFAIGRPQPSQQNFENVLANDYLKCEHIPTLIVEIENFIGSIILPHELRESVIGAPIVLVTRDFEDRVERLAAEYAPVWNDSLQATFEQRMLMLKSHLSHADRAAMIGATARGDFRTAVEMLLSLRYDPVYDKGIRRLDHRVVARFNLTHEKQAAIAYLKEAAYRPLPDSVQSHVPAQQPLEGSSALR